MVISLTEQIDLPGAVTRNK